MATEPTERTSATAPKLAPAELRAEAGSTCQAPDPLGILREEHALQNELCDLLEAIADGLPHQFDRSLASVAVSILETGVPGHMRLEEEALFPLLRRRVPENHALHSALACLEDEHDRDGASLVEIIEALRSAIASGGVPNPDMLGYMLRGFFDSQRRHIAWEEAVVLPTADTVLTANDLGELQDWVMQSGHPRCCRQSIVTLRKAREGADLCRDCAVARPSATKPQ
ncbi:MAG: hemerythrin domain-containing protein [Hyphomicrobium sp.]